MITFLIYLFSFLLIIDCLFLGLLVLVQLPKKEAGVGMAFGGGAADALFGAGSGSALTKLTKYSSIAFFVLVIGLSFLNGQTRTPGGMDLKRALEKQSAVAQPPTTAVPAVTASNTTTTPAVPLSITSTSVPAPTVTVTNMPAPAVK